MKRALVVYESLFGDARTIAQSIVAGLADRLLPPPAQAAGPGGSGEPVGRHRATGPDGTVEAVDLVEVGQAPATIGTDVALLVVGGPNHQFGMPRPASRAQAVRDFHAGPECLGPGLREWLHRLTVAVPGVPAAAFDTRLVRPRFLRHVDHATHTERRLLRRAGLEVIVPAEHFFVSTAKGPLVDGDADRARRWGATVADRLVARLDERSG